MVIKQNLKIMTPQLKFEATAKGAISTLHSRLDGLKKGVKYNFDDHARAAINDIVIVYSLEQTSKEVKEWIEKESLIIVGRFKDELIDNEALPNEDRRKYLRMRQPLIPISNNNFY